MSAAEKQEDTNTEPDNVDVGLVGTITVVGALLVVAIAAALTALVRVEQNNRGDEVGAYADLGGVARLRTEQNDRLNAAPKWADKAKGLVSIPIDRAMTLVSEDIQRQPALATPTAPGESSADAGAEAGVEAGAAAAEAGTAEEDTVDSPEPTPQEVPGAVPSGTPAPQQAPAPNAPSATPPAPKAPGGASAAPKPKQPLAPKGSTSGAPTAAAPKTSKPGATAPAAGGQE